MSKINKKVLLSFDQDIFLEFRKILFQNGISVQDFFSNIMVVVNNRDENCEYLFEKIRKNKQENIANGKEETIKAEMFYEMFEKNLKQDE